MTRVEHLGYISFVLTLLTVAVLIVSLGLTDIRDELRHMAGHVQADTPEISVCSAQ